VRNACLLLFLILPFISVAQHPYFQNLVNSDGIESNNVYCCFQDKEGFMWFGTDLGVSRFNGYEFENFDSDDGLTGNEIFGIYQDSKGRMWFRSFNGEFCYYLEGEFYNNQNDSTLAKLKSDSYLTSVFEDDAGTIYITCINNGVFIIDTLNNVRNISFDIPLYRVWVTNEGILKLFTSEGLYRLEGDDPILETSLVLSSSHARSIVVGDKVLFGFGADLILLDGTVQLMHHLPDGSQITWLSKGDGDAIFIGTRSGMHIYDFAKREMTTAHYFPESIVSHTLIDKEGNLWVTTLGEGVFLAPSPQTKIYNKEGDLPVSNITCLEKGLDNDLWIGMVGGYYANLKNGVLKTRRIKNHHNQSTKHIRIIPDGQIIIANKANTAVFDGEETVYFPFLSNDILIDSTHAYIASKRTFKITAQSFSDKLGANPDGDKDVEEGLQDHLMMPVYSSVLVKGKNNAVYVGTQKGLYKDDQVNIIHLGEECVKLGVTINDLAYDSENDLLYVATNGEGLIVLENDEIKYVIDEEKGLSSNNCRSLLIDEGALWVGTSKSLDHIYKEGNVYKLVNHGAILNLKDSRISAIERIGDVLYLATNDGLIAHNLNVNEVITTRPKLYLEHIYVNSTERIISEDKMHLRHNENSISFSFLGLSYKNLGNLTYEYKLEGYQKDWQKTKSREVFFDGLNAGDYTFNLRIKNWENQEIAALSIPFEIEKPYWKTAWFLTLMICIIAGVVMLIWFVRIRNIRANYELEKQIFSGKMEKLELEKAYLIAEQKAGVLQMNPHFLFNSLNTIKGYYAQNKFNEANRFIARFSKLLRRILECNTQFIPLEKELEIVDLYLFLMQKRYDNMFQYKITCDVEAIGQIEIPPMMVQPMVENAVVHGIAPHNKGLVEVHFYFIEKQLACSVSDTGIGFNNSVKQTHESVGLSNIRDRLNLLSQQFSIPCSIKINSPNNKEKVEGTTVTILFPTKINSNESHNN
jgi:ligand-binding sensor domain-containing protein